MFMCVSYPGMEVPGEPSKPFTAELGAKNGVPARKYTFQRMSTEETSGSFSDIMEKTCKSIGMLPLCESVSYCKQSLSAIYIGQDAHLEHGGQMVNKNYFPSGWDAIKSEFFGLCAYTAKGNGDSALCNDPWNSHSWRKPGQNGNNEFMCGKFDGFEKEYAPPEEGKSFKVELGGMGGVPPRTWEFALAKVHGSTSGRYSDLMKAECKKLGMKPVCDHKVNSTSLLCFCFF